MPFGGQSSWDDMESSVEREALKARLEESQRLEAERKAQEQQAVDQYVSTRLFSQPALQQSPAHRKIRDRDARAKRAETGFQGIRKFPTGGSFEGDVNQEKQERRMGRQQVDQNDGKKEPTKNRGQLHGAPNDDDSKLRIRKIMQDHEAKVPENKSLSAKLQDAPSRSAQRNTYRSTEPTGERPASHRLRHLQIAPSNPPRRNKDTPTKAPRAPAAAPWLNDSGEAQDTAIRSPWGRTPPPPRPAEEEVAETWAEKDANLNRDRYTEAEAEAEARQPEQAATEQSEGGLSEEDRQMRNVLAQQQEDNALRSDREDFATRVARQGDAPLKQEQPAKSTAQLGGANQSHEHERDETGEPSPQQSLTAEEEEVRQSLSQRVQEQRATVAAKPTQTTASQPQSKDSDALLSQALGETPEQAARRLETVAQPAVSNAGPSQPGALSESEEKMLQALLARKTASLQPSAPCSTPNNQPPLDLSADELEERNILAAKFEASRAEQKRLDQERQERNARYEPQRSYRIRMTSSSGLLDPQDEPIDPQLTSQWNLVKRKEEQKTEEASTTFKPFVSQQKLSPEDIDAKFEEHRRQRSLRNAPHERRNVASTDVFKKTPFDSSPRVIQCGRCREEGHHASECTKPFTCYKCGEDGHMARNCPSKTELSKGDDFFNRYARLHRPSDDVKAPEFRGVRSVGVNTPGVRKTEFSGKKEEESDLSDRELARLHWQRQMRQDAERKRFEGAPREEEQEDEVPRPAVSGRFAARFGMEEEVEEPTITRERGRKPRRSRFEDDDIEDEGPRRGRRGRFADDDGGYSLDDMHEDRQARKDERQKKRQKAAKEAEKKAVRAQRKAEALTPIQLPEFISVSQLAQTLGVKLETFIRKVESLGFNDISHDHILSSENASLIAMEYNFEPTFGDAEVAEERDLKARPEVDDKEFLPTRPPVVAIMGHVDHGKTTILDFLRKSSVAATEHGGITQHIGAFSVALSSGKTITFLDTPGHAAFLAMRQRGANVTDIVVLVVAADDSVKPQTIEAIRHAKAANVPIIVAINKVDKEEANIERCKQDLARHGVEIEDYGGDTQVVCVSGKTGEGMETLEEAAVTLGEILDHRAETDGMVEGWVLEATTKKSGRVATVLVKRGTLKAGNIIVAGKTWARVRSLRNEAGVAVHEAGPGTPVEVDGWKDQPVAGDEVLQAPNEQKATDVVEYRQEKEDRVKMAEDMEAINETRRLESDKRAAEDAATKTANSAEGAAAADKDTESRKDESTGHQTVPFIIKADVSGSVEAVSAYVLQMSNPLCSPTVLRSGVGPVSEFDIEHAAAAQGHIVSFNLPEDPQSVGKAEQRGVKILEQNVIYRIVDQIKAVLEDKLPPVRTQRVTGEADVAAAFEIGVGGRKKIKIAGCKIRNGTIGRNKRVRVLRGEEKIYDGTVESLKNVKKDVTEMRKGTECGIGFDGWEAFEVGDQIQTYEEIVEKRTLQI
ncbi:translation initiation factor IF-2 [Zalaria obscura]|uniref:Translation initiation factor IF-2 n=1 Tax=Zalaria obscura TaxID=2024903 RepID=A0ACC3SRA0_9PEZI